MPAVTVDLRDYEKALGEYADELLDYALQRRARNRSKTINPASIATRIEALYPESETLRPFLRELRNGTLTGVNELLRALYEVRRVESGPVSSWLAPDFEERLRAFRGIADDLDALEEQLLADPVSDEELVDSYRASQSEALAKTRAVADRVSDSISAAIGRTPFDPPPVPVRVEARFNREGEPFEAPGVWSVEFGRGDDVPMFSAFADASGKIDSIEDLLEAGDSDFFRDSKVQAFYFAVVSEIRKPGSTSRGRPITLYTARPVKDRARYEGARDVPANIFLTTSFSEAEGIAGDLGGSEERRDVWRVVVDSKYLIETNRSGGTRHYQAVGNESRIPVSRIVLESEGSTGRTASVLRVVSRRLERLRARSVRS